MTNHAVVSRDTTPDVARTRTPRPSATVHRDGPGIRREMRTIEELERAHPELAGRLEPPSAGSTPPGINARLDRDGDVRVLTINVHEGVPANEGLDDDHESLSALRDVARYVAAVDPDVVLVQELTSHPAGTWGRDLEEQPSILGRLIEADDMAFAPAFRESWWRGETGTAIYTRNGFTIDQAINAALPAGVDTQPRGVAIAAVVPPPSEAGATPFTVVGTHLAHGSFNGDAREEQLTTITELVGSITRTGAVDYEPRMSSGWRRHTATATGFPSDRILFGGDLNALQRDADPVVEPVGLQHVNEGVGLLRRRELDVPTATRNRIDHLYSAGFDVLDASVGRVPNRELRGPNAPTDHAGVVADLSFQPAPLPPRGAAP